MNNSIGFVRAGTTLKTAGPAKPNFTKSEETKSNGRSAPDRAARRSTQHQQQHQAHRQHRERKILQKTTLNIGKMMDCKLF